MYVLIILVKLLMNHVKRKQRVFWLDRQPWHLSGKPRIQKLPTVYLYGKFQKNAYYLLALKSTHFRCQQLRT